MAEYSYFDVVTYALLKRYTDSEIQKAIEGISGGMTFKGEVDSIEDLPSDASNGDYYIVNEEHCKAVWVEDSTGSGWVFFDKDLVLVPGEGIDIYEDSEGNTIIENTQTSAEWGNISGNIEDQTDLIDLLSDELSGKQDILTAGENISIIDSSEGTIISVPSMPIINFIDWIESSEG